MAKPRKTVIAFVTQYGSSVLNGLMSFLVVAVAANRLDDVQFSRLSTVLLQFSAYQICLDLGTHNLHVQRLGSLPRSEWGHANKGLLTLRLWLAVAACAFALLHAAIGRFSSEMSFSLLLFVGGFIPASIVSARDSFLFASGREERALWLRGSRVLALGALAASVVLFPKAPQPLHFAVFTVAMLGAGALAFRAFAREGMLARGKVPPLPAGARPDAPLILFYLSNAAFPVATNLVAIHLWGEGSLSLWNGSITASTPLTLAVQTWTLLLTRPYADDFSKPHLRARLERRFLWGLLALSVAGLLGFLVLLRLDVLQTLLRRPEPSFSQLVLLLGAWQCLWQVSGLELLHLQFARRTGLLLAASATSYALALGAMAYFGARFQEPGLAIGLLLQALLWALLMRLAVRHHLRHGEPLPHLV